MSRVLKYQYLLIVVFIVLQIIISSLIIYFVSLEQTQTYLEGVNQRVREDVSYSKSKWNTARYDADPELPETFPLYIISSDGYVIDRWKPVHGFLDTSDVEKLLMYKTPQTVITDTDDQWRIVSQAITQSGRMLGVITVAKHEPTGETDTLTDAQLNKTLVQLRSKIVLQDTTITAHAVDPRDIPYDISFQVVDNYNHIIINNNNTNSINRIPNYLDTSYFGNIINGPTSRQIRDTQTGQPYLIVSTPIFGSHHYIVGVIVAGREISSIFSTIKDFILGEILLGVVLLILLIRLLPNLLERLQADRSQSRQKSIQHISFNKKTGVIHLDNQEVTIPYATNQFYLCEALFSAPNKRWELDEILMRFGENELDQWRKVYDAMTSVNKKVLEHLDDKLIILTNKTYQINPLLVKKITSQNK